MAYELNFKIFILIKILQNVKFKKYLLDSSYILYITKDEESMLDGKNYIWEKTADYAMAHNMIPIIPRKTPIFRNRLKIMI